MTKEENDKFSYLLAMNNDARQEIKQRIAQRDSFAVQMIVSTGVILVAGLADNPYSPLIFLILPIIAWYYVSQIFSSYRMHDNLVKFLRGRLADELIIASGYANADMKELNWEKYVEYWENSANNGKRRRGTRKLFFEVWAYIVPLIAELLFWLTARDGVLGNTLVYIIMAATFVLYTALVWSLVKKKIAFKKAKSK